jgi:dipeptidyl-peptidase-4
MRKHTFFLILLSWLTIPAIGQKQITIDDLYGRPTFNQKSVYGINWMNDGRYYTALENNNIVKYDVTSGEIVSTLLDGSTLNPSIRFDEYQYSSDQSKILLRTEREGIYRRSFTARYFIFDTQTKTLTPLTSEGRQAYATFSPDGTKVAWVSQNNLFYKSLDSGEITQITRDGKFNEIINGSTDWVYEEELSFTRAFEWSGDSKSLFFLTFNEKDVPEFNMQKWNEGALYPEDYRFKYPKAGEQNSMLKTSIYDVEEGVLKEVKIGEDQEYYIARIRRTEQDNEFSLIRLNRLQNTMNILHVNAETADVDVVYTDAYETYVDVDFVDDLTYLEDGKHFLISSERDGFKHIYLYSVDGELVRQVTRGKWEVSSVEGIDQKGKNVTIYYTSTEESPLERYLYVTDLEGKKKERLTREEGTHSINMSKDQKYYIDYHSNSNQPLRVTLYRTKGNKKIKVLEDNAALTKKAEEYALRPKEFFSFPTTDGTTLHGYMLKPANMDVNKKYPLLIYQYSGPGSQNVTNSWGGGHYYWHQMLVQKGYIVAVVDTRGTGGRGAEFKKITYEQLGKYEVEDHMEGAKYLGGLPYVDEERIGIWGWSYGGYMSSLAILKGADLFKAAIAVAPVTNWRYYDTIYTERYMGLPQDNPSGYDENSPTSHAGKLVGNFLLIHGTGDDNVHFQNAVALQNALIAAGKQFDSFYYPDRAHGIYQGNARPHLFSMMTNWLEENL